MREGEKGQRVRERGLHERGMEYVEARLILISVHATSAGLPATTIPREPSYARTGDGSVRCGETREVESRRRE